MKFDYSKLLGKIKEKGLTQETLAKTIGITPGSVSEKLNNKANFKQKEIFRICQTLGISDGEVGEYFFTQKVR